jgi:hypothetical protein
MLIEMAHSQSNHLLYYFFSQAWKRKALRSQTLAIRSPLVANAQSSQSAVGAIASSCVLLASFLGQKLEIALNGATIIAKVSQSRKYLFRSQHTHKC